MCLFDDFKYDILYVERRVSMRLKHIKGATEKIEASSYIVLSYKDYKGKWSSIFKNNHPIYMEIGMGKGKFIIENALKNPNINYIGIEKYDSVLVRAVEKLEKLNLSNIKIIRMDAREIEEVFSKEIDLLYLNFSDPWPKRRHEIRRLTSKNYLTKYDKIFKKTCLIIQKTDNRDLFIYSLMSFNNNGYKFKELSFDYNDIDNITTEYEDKFRSKGNPIYRVYVQK